MSLILVPLLWHQSVALCLPSWAFGEGHARRRLTMSLIMVLLLWHLFVALSLPSFALRASFSLGLY
jgi:hypothetical protein